MSGNIDREFIVEDVQAGGWHVQAWIEWRQGAPWITELRLRSANGRSLASAHGPDGPRGHYPHENGRSVPEGGITTPVLRALSTQDLYDAIGRDNASASTLTLCGVDADQDFVAFRRPGRRGRDDIFYAIWADRYLARCKKSRHPYPDLAAEHPDHEIGSIRAFVQEARRRGLLVGMSKGRAGGKLSEKAMRLLDRAGAAPTPSEPRPQTRTPARRSLATRSGKARFPGKGKGQ